MVRRAIEDKKLKFRNVLKNSDIFLRIHKVNLRGPAGSIEGPMLVLDPLEVLSFVPRVPWNVFVA